MLHEIPHEMRHAMPHEIVRTKFSCECLRRFLVFGGGRRRGWALANDSEESIMGPFRAAILGGNSGAISRGQFRAGNFAQAISRPCVVLPAARACRLPLASRVVFAAATTLIGHNVADDDGRSADGSRACGNDEKGTWSNGADGRAARGVRPAVPQMANQIKLSGAPGQFRCPFRALLCL